MTRNLRKSNLLIGLVLALMAASTVNAADSSATTCPGRNGRIAVVVQAAGGHGGDYITMVSANRRTRPLFAPPEVFAWLNSPSFSCSGNRLIFGGNNGGPYFIEEANAWTGEKLPPHVPGQGWRFPQLPFPLPDGFWPSKPSYLGDGRIVFTTTGGKFHGGPGTWIIEPDGSGLHRLFSTPASAVTTDGHWFVTSDTWGHNLFLRQARGRVIRRLVPTLHGTRRYGSPNFSPDGRWIAFERDADLVVVRRDGTHLQRLTDDSRSRGPVFSPDGRWIAFTRAGRPDGPAHEVVSLSVTQPRQTRIMGRIPEDAPGLGDLAWAAR